MKQIIKKPIIFLSIFLLVNSLILSGCADESELNEVQIVLGMAIDKTSGSDSINITLEVVNPKESSGGSIKNSLMVKTQGKSIYDAIQNLYKSSSTIVDFSHCNVFILSKELSQSGISKVMDYIYRERQVRNDAWLLVSSKSAEEILQGTISNEDMTSKGIDKMLTQINKDSYIIPITISNFILGAESESHSSFVPVVEAEKTDGNPQGTIKIDKMAVFSKDHLVGILNSEESQNLLWLPHTPKGRIILFPFKSDNNYGSIAVEVSKKYSKITANVTDEGTYFNIECGADIVLKQMPNMNITPQLVSKIESSTENMLKAELNDLLEKSQKDFNVDFVGFSNKIYMNYPQKWYAMKNHWKEIFPTIKYQIDFNANVTGIGMVKNSPDISSEEESSK